jgi:SAM-dependent methyltransferase
MRVRQGSRADDIRARTYRSFGLEWQSFSAQLPEYAANFRWYCEPLEGQSFTGRLVLDAGCGMGRHAYHLLADGARVVGLDASPAIDVAAANNRSDGALFVQADLLHLPLASDAFDVVCCLGVLHHLEDASKAMKELVRVLRPDGWLLIYVYHDPSEVSWIRGRLLRTVNVARTVTTRMPFLLQRALTFLLAAGLYAAYTLPCKMLSRIPALRPSIAGLPLGQYVDYPFRMLWNDQLDRFSAPLERRYRRAEVGASLAQAGLDQIRTLGGYGWRGAGRKPSSAQPSDARTGAERAAHGERPA